VKLEPWQAELLINMEKSAKLVFTTARQSGKSDWVKLFQEFMNPPKNHFVPFTIHHQVGVMIEDYMWWVANEREIYNWMAEHLPRGIEHQQGMTVVFDNEEDRLMFMLRWA
jgi:hypothetical protein